jgi:hypothetical protein
MSRKSWRDVLPIHPATELFPRMSDDELRALGEDIIKNGLTSPIVLWRANAKAAPVRHRERLMGMFARSGKRPMGWWDYEAEIAYPGYEREQSTLYDAGLLDEEEKAELEAKWRYYFDEAQGSGFTYCTGHSWLKGAAARRRHYAWADISRSLTKRWRAERRRTIRKLESNAGEPAQEAAPVRHEEEPGEGRENMTRPTS